MGKNPLPKFTSAAEEASWYAEHEDQLNDYFEELPDSEAETLLLELPPKNTAMNQAKEAERRYRARTTPTSIRLSSKDIEAAKQIAAKKGIGYQTLIKMFVHEWLESEKNKAR